jgi:maltose alpha-D-glucosyltransferase/alpha-amylase
MVTDEERDAMYRFYALEPQAKVNLGLRRRLAPLLRNDRRRLELMHALLFSMPGTPVMYYGDEIRMGDNIYLRDRDSVRTPMQWSADRNGGFSRANPQRLFLSPITDPQFHFLSCNVETEEQSPHSLLWWLRRVLHLRRRYQAFGRGNIEFLLPKNPRILVFLRRYRDETLLAVFNLSRSAQFVELDLAQFRGRTPVELFAETRFPMIGELPYLLTVGPHGFYWFRLDWPKGEETRRGPADLPSVLVDAAWTDAFRRPTIDGLQDALRDYLGHQAWHAAPHSAVIRRVEVEAVVPLPEADEDGSTFAVVLVRVHYVAGESALYQLTLMAAPRARAEDILRDRPTAGLFRAFLRRTAATWYVCDASAERSFWTRWSKQMADAGTTAAAGGRLEFHPLPGYASPDPGAIAPVRRHGAAGGNAAASAGPYFFTVLRRVEAGIHPEVEIGTLAHERGLSLPVPALRGTCRFRRTDLGPVTLGTVDDFFPCDHPLSSVVRGEVRRGLELVSAEPRADAVEQQAPIDAAADVDSPASTQALRARLQALFAHLGGKLAEVHRAVAALVDVPAFAPDAVSSHYRQSLYFGFRAQAVRTFAALRTFADRTPELRDLAEVHEVVAGAERAERRFETLLGLSAPLLRIRCHGAFRLDDALLHGSDLAIASWGGHSDRSLTDRRIKRVALVDLAAAAQSLTGIVFDALAEWSHKVRLSAEAADKAKRWADCCRQSCLAACAAAYRAAVAGKRLVPDDVREFEELFLAFRLQAAITDLDRALDRESAAAVTAAAQACRELLA